MKLFFSLVFMGLAAFSAQAQEDVTITEPPVILDAKDVDLNDFLWIKRPLVIFADTPADPRYVQQVNLVTERMDALEERDVVVITDTDPRDPSAVRTQLRPRGFMFALVGKDGRVYLRKPEPWDVREISRSIDKMPLRQQEIRDRRDSLRN